MQERNEPSGPDERTTWTVVNEVSRSRKAHRSISQCVWCCHASQHASSLLRICITNGRAVIVARKASTEICVATMARLWANASGVATGVWECHAYRGVLKVCQRIALTLDQAMSDRYYR
jgi:hypothetical protein